ncbi:MAG: endonuclease/exonuclease/phosphatase family protein, partial [bacterium]|nr:endonuclease/exonuclease/phosphatase family protein [bacterium]
MNERSRWVGVLAATAVLVITPLDSRGEDRRSNPAHTVRFAAFNVWELSTAKLERADADGRGVDPQLRKAAEIVQRVRPDVLLINEIDFDAAPRRNAQLLLERYLNVPQGDQQAIDYPHLFFEPVNTGVPSGLDLDNDG